MITIESTSSSEILFRSPLRTRIGHALGASAACVLVTIIVAASVSGVFVIGSNGGPPPLPAVMAGVAVGLAAGLLVGVGYRRVLPTSLQLRSDGLMIGGRLLGKEIAYEDVRLTKLEEPERGSRRDRIIRIRGRRGPEYALWLTIGDADDCHEALRSFCEDAAVIGSDGELDSPQGGTLSDSAREALAEEYRRRSIRSLASAVFLAALAMFLGWMLLTGNVSAYTRVKATAGVIFLPIGAVGLVIKFFVERRRAREIEP